MKQKRTLTLLLLPFFLAGLCLFTPAQIQASGIPCAVLVAILLRGDFVQAEQRWIHVTLEKSAMTNRRGNPVDKPVFYAKKQYRITKGGEWIVPEVLTKHRAIERYQREGTLLMLVDVPPETALPGTVKNAAQAEAMKRDVFRIPPVEPAKPESGVTK